MIIKDRNAALHSLFNETLEFSLGVAGQAMASVTIAVAELLTSMLVLGRPGSGKTMLLRLLIRQLFSLYIPTVLIDAEGDLAEDTFADAIEKTRGMESEALLHRVQYLRVDWKKSFTIDPFRQDGIPDDPKAIQAWLTNRADKLANAIIRGMGETSFEQMPRLKRVLTDLLIAIGTTIGPNGARLPLAYVFVLLNFDHPKFDTIYALIKPSLPREIRQDFDQLLRIKDRPNDFLGQTESTINRLRGAMPGIVQAIFSEVGSQTLDLQGMIRNRCLIIFNLRDSQYFSPEQADSLGKIIIYMVISAMQSIDDRGERVACCLVVDECQRFCTEDIITGIVRGRKWGLMTVLATQLFSSLERVEEGFADMVLGAVGTVACFQQRLEKDLQVLVPYLFRPNYVLDELYREVDRHRGYRWFDVIERSENWSSTTTVTDAWSRVVSTSRGSSFTSSLARAISKALARSSSWNKAKSHTDSSSTSNTESDMAGSGTGESAPLFMPSGMDGLHLPSPTISSFASSGHVSATGESNGEADTEMEGSGGAIARIDGEVKTEGEASGASLVNSNAQGVSRAIANSVSNGGGRSFKKVPLAIIEAELQPSGQFRFPIDMQNEIFKTYVAQLPAGVFALRREGKLTDIVQTYFVEDPFPDPKLKRALIEQYLLKLQAIHLYWIEPDLSDDNYEQTIDDFIAAASAKPQQPTLAAPPAQTGPF